MPSESVPTIIGRIEERDGQRYAVILLGGKEVALPLTFGEDGLPEPVKCLAEHTTDPDGTPHLKLHVPCLSVVREQHHPGAGVMADG